MVGESTESPSSNMMTEGLLTSSFGSHESVCKSVQPDCGQVRVQGVETTKIQLIRSNLLKVGLSFDPWMVYFTVPPVPLNCTMQRRESFDNHEDVLTRIKLISTLFFNYDVFLFSDENYFQLIGEFSLRENVFYGAIFLSMILIILFCFIFVNKTNHITPFHHQAIYDMGKSSHTRYITSFEIQQNHKLE